MPATTSVNITNQSQFTTYFSLISTDKYENIYGKNNDPSKMKKGKKNFIF